MTDDPFDAFTSRIENNKEPRIMQETSSSRGHDFPTTYKRRSLPPVHPRVYTRRVLQEGTRQGFPLADLLKALQHMPSYIVNEVVEELREAGVLDIEPRPVFRENYVGLFQFLPYTYSRPPSLSSAHQAAARALQAGVTVLGGRRDL